MYRIERDLHTQGRLIYLNGVTNMAPISMHATHDRQPHQQVPQTHQEKLFRKVGLFMLA